MCNIQSFINLRDWLHKIREFSDNDVVIGLVANKSDLVDEDDQKNGYGKYSKKHMQSNQAQASAPEPAQMVSERRTPRRHQDGKPAVYSRGPAPAHYDNDQLGPDAQDQMGLRQAQAMRKCFSDPDMS